MEMRHRGDNGVRFKSLRALITALALLSVSNSALAIAGKVVYSFGQVEGFGADGVTRPLARGDILDSGDSISTANGRAQVRFTDGGFVALQPNTTYRLDEYVYDGTIDGTEKSLFHLVEGGIRLVTGLIGRSNKRNFHLTTPVATIGIRGTSGLVSHLEGST